MIKFGYGLVAFANIKLIQTNIGIFPFEIPTAIKTVCDDVMYWNMNHIFSLEEIAVRLHHRLVYIHPFPNGNGRHARLVADAYLFYNPSYGLNFSKN